MQIFVRDPTGKTTSYNASSSSDLHAQVISSLSLQDATAARLSYRSRALNDDLQSIHPYATLDLNFRLLGGGPKKRCAHLYVKPASAAGSTSSSNAASGSATPASASAPVGAAAAVATSAPGPSAQASAQAPDAETKTEEKTAESSVDAEASTSTTAAAETASTGPEAATSTAAPVVQAHEPILERCGNAALRMVGECAKCSKNFCGQHRLPEDHACPALQTFRKAAFDENMKRLSKEATMTNKISAF